MKKISWLIVFVIKDFLGMLAAWQIDHAFSHYPWNSGRTLEIFRFPMLIAFHWIGVPVYMTEQSFWILCLAVFLLAVYLPEIVLLMKVIRDAVQKI